MRLHRYHRLIALPLQRTVSGLVPSRFGLAGPARANEQVAWGNSRLGIQCLAVGLCGRALARCLGTRPGQRGGPTSRDLRCLLWPVLAGIKAHLAQRASQVLAR
jgi:hypothetical protein